MTNILYYTSTNILICYRATSLSCRSIGLQCTNKVIWFCVFFLQIVTPTKRKRAALPTAKLTPVKKYHVSDFPVTESPSKAGHRLKPQKVSQTDCPFKSSTPTRAQTKAETLNRAPTNIQRKEEAVSHNHGSSPAPLKETDNILPTAKSCSQTQVMVLLHFNPLALFYSLC